MNPTSACDQSCSLAGVCQQLKDCASPPALISWPEVLGRFEREASHGIHNTGRYRLRYFSWGSGPPLLFVPGLSERPRAFLLVMSQLASRFRCLGMELPHGGRDGAVLGDYRHEHLAEDVHSLLDHLGLSHCYLFGASLGGTIVMRAMHSRPERVPRAIVQGSFAKGMLRWYEQIGVVFARMLPGRMRHMPLRDPVLRRVHRDHFNARPAEAWRYYLEGNGDVPIHTTAHQALLIRDIDLRPMLPNIPQPVMLVAGAEDDVVPGRCQDELLAALPNARLAELPKCGHIPHHTHPEALADLIGHFLTPQAVASPL